MNSSFSRINSQSELSVSSDTQAMVMRIAINTQDTVLPTTSSSRADASGLK